MVRGIVVAAVMALFAGGAAHAQGIDCAKARTPVEKGICAAPELVALDRQVGAAYADAVSRQPERAAALRQEQLAWLRSRDTACNVAAAQIPRCLSAQMSTRLAQLAPPPLVAAPQAPASHRPAQRQPAFPSDANPPAPAASVEPASFAAAEQTDATLRVTSPGRFSLAAKSATGVALQLVDQLTGPADVVGEAGVRDGRTDVLLDIGTYRLRAFAAKGAVGDVRLTAEPFRDATPPRALPPAGETFSAELRDGEQRAFWLLVPPSGAVQIEAAGRALADLRLWRAGRELTALEPQTRTVEPQPGHTLLDLRLSGQVEPGVYLAVAYGGPALPWADGISSMPFHLRAGLSEALAEGWAGGAVGPFGSERYAAPAFAGVFRLDLPAPAPAELRVDDRAAVLEKTSREPHATVRGEAGKIGVVEVRGAEGQGFTLRASAPASARSITRPGTYFVSAVANGAGGDEPPPTVLLQRTDPKLPARIAASNLPRLAPGTAWRGRFNLRGPTSLLFENAVGGPVAVRTTGISLGSEPGGYAQYDVPADTYVLRLRPAPGAQGVIDVTLGPPGAQPALPAPLPPDPVIPLGVQEVGPGQSLQLVAQSGPGLQTGLSARPVPVRLAEGPLAITQAAGSGPIAVPVVVAPGGELSARELAGAELAVTTAAQPGSLLVTVPASDRPRTVVLAWRRAVTVTDVPAPPAAASLPTLRPGTPVAFDLQQDEQRGFALDVPEGGLFRLETLGRLHTTGRLASAFIPQLDAAEANGTGENMLLQSWLRAGRYRVDVQARQSAGHLAVAANPAPLQTGAALVAGSSARATMAAGSGVAFPVRIERDGRYRLDVLSLGKPFTLRLDDAEGWPVTRPGAASALEQRLRPGTYRLLVSPEPVTRQVAARLTELVEPAAIVGHGPHTLPFGAPQSATWREPPGRSDPRTPDAWTFELAGPADVTLRIDDGMIAELRNGDQSVARLTRRWSGRLEAGTYRVDATSLGRNDRLDYTIGLEAKEIQPGETRMMALPSVVPFALAEARILTLTTWGMVPVKGVLRRADGTELLRLGARADDWNLALSRPLPAGAYRLELAPAVPPAGTVTTAQDPGVVQPTDTEDRSDEEDKPDTEDQEAQTAPRRARSDTSADADDAPAQSVEVRLALPSDSAVQTEPIDQPAPGTLVAAQAASEGTSVLALEREGADGWRTVAVAEGAAPLMAAPADASPQPWRVRAWSIEAATALRMQAGVVSMERQPPGTVTLRPAGRLALAAARVGLPSPGLVELDGALLAAGWPGHPAVPVEGGQALVQMGDEIWILAPSPGSANVAPVSFDAERAVAVPAGGAVALPELMAAPGRMRIWRAESGAGQPVLLSRSPGAIARDSAVAPAAAPVTLRAADAQALPVRLAPLDLAALAERGPGAFLLPPRSSTPVRLPSSGRIALTLPSGAAALASLASVWAGNAPVARDLFAEGVVTLVNTTDAAIPAALQWSDEQPWPALRPGAVFKRFFGAAGSFELPVEAAPGGMLAVAGDAELAAWSEDGRVRRGRAVRVESSARATVTHGPGAVVVSLSAPGISPWPQPDAQPVAPPREIVLSGPAMALAVAFETPVLLHATTTAPVLLGFGDRPPELFAAGAEFHRAVPAGPATLRLYSPHDGPLSGTLQLAAEPLRPAREGVGESVLVAPGGSAAWAFSLVRPVTVGVGVRADPDRAEIRLLDAKGAVVGEGVAQLRMLPAGRYVLEARVPPDAQPSLIRPALVGITPRGNGPPPDVVRTYLELVGLKPTEPRR